MAGNDPTWAGKLVQVDVPLRDRTFLQELIAMARDGVREELIRFPARRSQPAHLRREEAAFERLLAGLASGWMEVDAEVHATLVELGEVVDSSNEHARVVFEHEALQGLIAAVAGGAGSAG